MEKIKIETILRHAVHTAWEGVQKPQPNQSRFMQIQSMQSQNKIFFKIEYSEETSIEEADYKAMETRLLQMNGYIHMQKDRQRNILMIAIPCENVGTI